MKKNALFKKLERKTESQKRVIQYNSVEFSFKGVEAVYQFKIWTTRSVNLCVIIRENSSVLPRMKVGDILNVKYNFRNSAYLSEYLKTAIRFIIKQSKGRFKGHYVVGFEILKNQDHQ